MARDPERTDQQTPARGIDARPLALPLDVDDPAIEKASGIVEVPLRVQWSGPRRSYDLDDRRDLARVYEIVLQEGTEEDVRRFIDLDVLIGLWDDLFLPARVREAWAGLVREKRGLQLSC